MNNWVNKLKKQLARAKKEIEVKNKAVDFWGNKANKQARTEANAAKQAEEQKAFYEETIEAYRRRILLLEEMNKRLKDSNSVYKMGCNFYKKQVKWAFDMVRKLLEEQSLLREENAKLKRN